MTAQTATPDNSTVLLVGQFPPPVHGLANVNVGMRDNLEASGFRVEAFSTSPPVGRKLVVKYIYRMVKVSIITFKLIIRRDIHSPTIYFSGEAGLGVVLLLIMLTACRLKRYDAYLHHHNYSYINRPVMVVRLMLAFAPSNLVHIFLCDDMRNGFLQHYDRSIGRQSTVLLSNATFIRECADTEHHDVDRKASPLCIGILANLSFDKGLDTFVDLFERLNELGLEVRAVIAGPASDASVRNFLIDLCAKYPGAVSWLGSVRGGEKERFFECLDLFVFPTRYQAEAQPLVLLEALSFGCPILASNIACIGCDHAETPGRTVELNSFVDEAVSWIGARGGIDKIRKMRKVSRLRFLELKGASDNQLSSLISDIRTRSRKAQ